MARTCATMSAWLRPQSSAHWPRYTPGLGILNHVKFVWPGTASNLPPSAGIHQECATSCASISRMTVVFVGTTSSTYAATFWFSGVSAFGYGYV